MNFNLVFDRSGDAIPFVATNPELLEYFVEQIEQHNQNCFSRSNQTVLGVDQQVMSLQQLIKRLNDWLSVVSGQTFPLLAKYDYLDQNCLNAMHTFWAKLQNQIVDVNEVIKNHDQPWVLSLINQHHSSLTVADLADVISKRHELDAVNKLIHQIESMFDRVRFQCKKHRLNIVNKFGPQVVKLDVSNLYMPYDHLGRAQYDKFVSFDKDYKHNDENTFDELLGMVEIKLRPPETKFYSREYSQWCSETNRIPSGDCIPLGNIPDLQNRLHDYRILILRNLSADNTFRIHLNQG